MSLAEHTELLSPEAAVSAAEIVSAPNGLRYGRVGRLDAANATPAELARLVGTVPGALAAALRNHSYLFVPLALSGARLDGDDSAAFSLNDRTLIAPEYQPGLVDKSICHRNASVAGTEYVFLSSKLHGDRFALAFEFFINIAHNFVDAAGVPESFAELVWTQARTGIRGETSIDAWEHRNDALGLPQTTDAEGHRRTATLTPRPVAAMDEKARSSFHEAAFSDALAIYLLAIYLDFDYADLREREYPLLAPAALAERLRAVSALFPANDGYKFEILYRRRG